jgi:DNA replication and repair protein RecF
VIIQELKISHLRNLTSVNMELSAGINLITGPNASGKSSLIEAAYLLGRGKTFRESRQENIIQDGQQQATIFAKMLGNKRETIGLIQKRKGIDISINGNRESKVSTLADYFPLNLITPKTYEIIECGPEYRRRLLDWAVFHVEPKYKNIVSSYLKLVRERNQLLKSDHSLLPHWEQSLEKQADIINRYRSGYLEKLTLHFSDILSCYSDMPDIKLKYQQGSDPSLPLGKILQQKRGDDILRGFTTAGPHRADLKILVNRKAAKSRLSRGQQKIATIALIFAQVKLLDHLTGKQSLLLIDDLAAELDATNREITLALLRDMGIQVLITATSKSLVPLHEEERVFHVEQGVVG